MSSFRPGQVNRTKSVFSEPGGKGLNVAKVLRILDIPVMESGIVGGYNGRQICFLLDRVGLYHQLIHSEEESRLCLNVIDNCTGGILETGPEIDQKIDKLFKKK